MGEELALLLVDDEQLVHKGMRAFIDWNSYGIAEIHSAYHAFEAIEIARKISPQIVITDIRMPEMNGFELIEQLQNELPDAVFIVLSGYDEFSYAKRALSLGALGYLLKPVNEKELCSVITQAVQKLSEERERLRVRKELRRMYDGEKNHAAELILQSICKGGSGLSEEKLHASLACVGCHFASESYGLLCLVPEITEEFEDEQSIAEKMLELGELIRKTLCENLQDISTALICGFPVFTLIFSTAKSKGYLSAQRIFSALQPVIEEVFYTGIHAFYGGESETLSGLASLYAKTITDGENRKEEYGILLRSDSPAPSLLAVPEEGKIAEIKQYIREHLGENLSLSDIANKFYYNPSYLSRRFKEETGMLFLNFLNQERIALARRLIDEGERSTYLVCEKVGYKDYRYFINMFKKYAGQTPYQYLQAKERGKHVGDFS